MPPCIFLSVASGDAQGIPRGSCPIEMMLLQGGYWADLIEAPLVGYIGDLCKKERKKWIIKYIIEGAIQMYGPQLKYLPEQGRQVSAQGHQLLESSHYINPTLLSPTCWN